MNSALDSSSGVSGVLSMQRILPQEGEASRINLNIGATGNSQNSILNFKSD